jgi:UDP-glucose 4-epimerase
MASFVNNRVQLNLDSKRILVTGGAGFIGSRFADDVITSGADVHIVDNFFTGKEKLIPDEATLSEIDIRDDEFSTIMGNFEPDAIVHLAAIHYVPYCNENPKTAFDVNVMGTRNVLNATKNYEDIDNFVFASTAAVYPAMKGPLSEDGETDPIDIYGETKLIGEDLVKLYAQELDISASVARLFNTYGPKETNPHLIPAILEQIEDGDREIELGNLTPKRDFIHVADVSRALEELLSFDGEFRPFNVGTGKARSVREVVRCASEAMNQEIEIIQNEDRERENDRPHLQADIGRINEEFGWKPEIEFIDGLARLINQELDFARLSTRNSVIRSSD